MLHLGLDEFLSSEPVHIIAPIGVTFPRVKSSSGVAPPSPPSSGYPTAEEYVDPTAAVDLPPSTSSDSSIQSMLDTVIIVQMAQDQLLVDVLMELQALHADLASI